MVIGPAGEATPRLLHAQLDLVNLAREWHSELESALGKAGAVSRENASVGYSHTHAAGMFRPDRLELPGGELIPDYLQELFSKLEQASQDAVGNVQEVVITYAAGRCSMAANRDYWDEANNLGSDPVTVIINFDPTEAEVADAPTGEVEYPFDAGADGDFR